MLLFIAYRLYHHFHSEPVVSPIDGETGQPRVVLITACDAGFGYTLARHLEGLGYTVLAGCLKEDSRKVSER